MVQFPVQCIDEVLLHAIINFGSFTTTSNHKTSKQLRIEAGRMKNRSGLESSVIEYQKVVGSSRIVLESYLD